MTEVPDFFTLQGPCATPPCALEVKRRDASPTYMREDSR